MENKDRFILASPFLLIISIFILSIGYASINSITGEIKGTLLAVVQNGVFITDATYVSSINANEFESKINGFHKSTLNSTIALSQTSPNSSITYEITLYNNTNDSYFFNEVLYAEEFYDNNGITFTLNGLKSNDILDGKNYLTFTITFSYLNDQIPDNNVLNSYLNFEFIKLDDVSASDNLKLVYTISDGWTEGDLYFYKCDFTLTNIGTIPVKNWSIDIPFSTEYTYNSSWADNGSIKFNFDDSENINVSSEEVLGAGASITFTIQVGVKNDDFDFGDIETDGTVNNPDDDNIYFTTPGIEAIFTKSNSWTSGPSQYYYQYSLNVKNTTNDPISDWQVVIAVPTGSSINQFWNVECELIDNVIIIKAPTKILQPNYSYTEGGIIIMVPDSNYSPIIK